MRTFHTGGVAGVDITQGLPRVEELFEARIPKGKAIISEIDGELEIIRQEGARKVRVISKEEFEVSYPVQAKMEALVKSGDDVMEGQELARDSKGSGVRTRHAGKVTVSPKEMTVRTVDEEIREYPIPHQVRIRPEQGGAEHHIVVVGGVLPGDDPGPHRGRDLRQGGPAPGPEGERDHRQADPGRDRARLLQEAAGAGGPDPRRGAN